MSKRFFPQWIVSVLALLSFSGIVNAQTESGACAELTRNAKNYFTEWNDCEALTVLKEYVEDVTNPQSANFINEDDRIATFDIDGTIIGELYPSYFEYCMLEYRVLDDPAYKDQAPADVRQTVLQIRDHVRKGTPLPDHFDMRHGRAAAKAYSGMTMPEFRAYVQAYAAKPVNGFSGMTYGESFYKPMLQVLDYLRDYGFTIYLVSGSDRYLCRALVEPLGFSPNRVIGMDVQLCSTKQGSEPGVDYTMGKEESVIRTDSLLIKNLKTNKVLSINREIGKCPVLSFGNSSGDAAMHNYCMSNSNYRTATFMLVADDAVRDYADLAEAARREARWRQNGYTVISMKNDFKTIYGEGVKKTKFHFK